MICNPICPWQFILSLSDGINKTVITFLAHGSNSRSLDLVVVLDKVEKFAHTFNRVIGDVWVSNTSTSDHVVHNLEKFNDQFTTHGATITHNNTARSHQPFCFGEIKGVQDLIGVDEDQVKLLFRM